MCTVDGHTGDAVLAAYLHDRLLENISGDAVRSVSFVFRAIVSSVNI